MDNISKLETKLFENDFPETSHYSNILNNMRYRGWYKVTLDEGFLKHYFCIFRMPPAIHLYDHILKKFSIEERKAGLHRMLVGKELREEMDSLLSLYNGDINECVTHMEDDQVKELLGRLQNIVTFDCNKIPYLYVKKEEDTFLDVDYHAEKHILGLPNYLDIFYKTLNEKITLDEANDLSNGVIYNEYIKDILKK